MCLNVVFLKITDKYIYIYSAAIKNHIDPISSAYMKNVCSNYTDSVHLASNFNTLYTIVYNKIPTGMFELGVQQGWDVR